MRRTKRQQMLTSKIQTKLQDPYDPNHTLELFLDKYTLYYTCLSLLSFQQYYQAAQSQESKH